MKKINIIFLSLLTVVSCGLDYNETSTYSKEDIFAARVSGIDKMVWGIYAQMKCDKGNDFSDGAMLCSASDEAVCSWPNSDIHNFYNGGWSALNPLSDAWSYYFTAIRQANFFLAEASELTFDEYKYNKDYEDYMKKYSRYKYEVRFLRAFFYFNLVRAYGDVPLITTVLTPEEANKAYRVPSAKIFDFIISECNDVIPHLSTDYNNETGQETGRATRQMAYALKARAALYAASPLFNDFDDPRLWERAAKENLEAIRKCEEFGAAINNYSDLWGAENYRNSEIILSLRESESSYFEAYNYPIGVEGGRAANCPSQTLVDAYDVKPAEEPEVQETDVPETEEPQTRPSPYDNLDPRFAMTIARNDEIWPAYNPVPLQIYAGGDNGLPLAGASQTGYYLKKYCDTSVDLRPNNSTDKQHSFIVFRLGELYLNYAEAVFRTLGNAQVTSAQFPMSANQAVNAVRTRADVNMPPFEGSKDFFNRYVRERMVELAFEEHRFWDVRRWKKGAECFSKVDVMEVTKAGDTFNYRRKTIDRAWDDKMYFFPIPAKELAVNKNLTQNIGW